MSEDVLGRLKLLQEKIMTKKRIMLLFIVFVLIVTFVIWGIHDNSALQVTKYTITSEKIPDNFNGYKIAVISDLHNAKIGKENEKLINMLESTKPDIIAITGDMIDSRHTNIEVSLNFAKEAVQIAPCYYVAGNHESRIEDYNDFEKKLSEIGVNILNDKQIKIEKEGQNISLLGVKDATFQKGHNIYSYDVFTDKKLKNFEFKSDEYTVLLAHRPEIFDVYSSYDIDLVLSGHTHGGQIRVPFIGSIAVPDQGFFPNYDVGLYTENNTKMIISKGIGNSMVPLRINNPPEIVLVTLTK